MRKSIHKRVMPLIMFVLVFHVPNMEENYEMSRMITFIKYTNNLVMYIQTSNYRNLFSRCRPDIYPFLGFHYFRVLIIYF